MKPEKKRTAARADIQGLRALAVLAVIADHLFHWPSGGFVGVDIFFVISGFLITGLLLREHQKSGTISFPRFYARRAKRILPVSIVVLVATVLTANVLFNAFRAQQTVIDAVWAFLFSANWHFAFSGTDYFAAGGPVSPLQHYWSLAVEEQFYFVWPWVMLLILALAVRRFRLTAFHARLAVGIAVAIIIAASFLWSLAESRSAPTMAYFSTFSRAWELGVGALLAVASPLLERIPGALRPLLAWSGLALAAVSLGFITDDLPFPAPWAIFPVLATALVIGAGTGNDRPGPIALRVRPVTYVGDISYSLYLWHFPVIVFAALLLQPDDALLYPVTIAVIFALSIGGYHLIEKPIQKSPLLTRYSSKRTRGIAWTEWRATYVRTYLIGALSTAVVAALALSGVALLQPPEGGAVEAYAVQTVAPTASPAPTDPFQQGLVDALATTAWPTLTPSITDVLSQPQLDDDVTACGKVYKTERSSCQWGSPSASKKVVLLGDSTSMYYTGIFKRLAEQSNGSLFVATEAMFGCRFLDLTLPNTDPNVVAACPGRVAAAVDLVEETKPDIVVITNSYEFQNVDGSPLPDRDWAADAASMTRQLTGIAGTVVFLAAPPRGVELAECYTPQSRPSSCVGRVSQQWKNRVTTESETVSAAGAIVIDTKNWYCVADRCPAFTGDTVIRFDVNHLTSKYAETLSPVLQQAFAAAGVPLS